MPANVVEGVLRGVFSDGISPGIDKVQAGLHRAMSAMQNSAATFARSIRGSFASAGDSLANWGRRWVQRSGEAQSHFHKICLAAVGMAALVIGAHT